MTKKEFFTFIQDEEKAYEEGTLTQNPSFAPTQRNILDLIDFYTVSRFRDGDQDILGFKKVFYNIVNFPVEIASKMLNIDTKHFSLTAEDDWASYWPAWIMSKELRLWLKDKYFGRELNAYVHNWAKYGDLWLKKVKDEVKWVPPHNMIYRPDADNYKNIPLIEKHEYDPDVLRVVGKKAGWENIEQAVKKGEKEGKVNVYEIYMPEGWSDMGYNWFVISDLAQEVLAYDNRDCPYKKLAWESLPGRLSGRGQVEKLFEEQIYLNRLANYKSQGLHWTSKHIYQTRDTKVASNLMTNIKDGDVLFLNDELRPVPVEERNMSLYASEQAQYEGNAFKRAFASEPITGSRAPAGTPLGSTVLQARMASGFYDQKKQDLADFLKEVFFDWVLPEFKNQKRSEHKLLMKSMLSNDDNSDKFFQAQLANEMNKEGSKRLTSEQRRVIKAIKAEKLKNTEFTIPKSFYENLKYKVRIDIVGEAVDTAGKMTTLQTVFQMLGSNPTILQDKRVRRVFEKMLNLAGFNPKDIVDDEVESITDVAGALAQRGGSLPSPSPQITMPQTATEQLTV